MPEPKDSCVTAAKGPIIEESIKDSPIRVINEGREGTKMTARVGKPAPDFELSAFVDGGFKNIRLSDYKGKWIVVCFYPGDFTFV